MDSTRKAYIELHFAVLLFGFTAILGDLIQLSAVIIVWWRVLLTSISLLMFINLFKLLKKLPLQMTLKFVGIGILVGIHWITFYGSVKLSNASVCLICMATTSFFTALIEPYVFKQKIKWYEVSLGLFIIPGMLLIVNNVDTSMYAGIIVGLISAFLASLFAVFNKKLIDVADPMQITLLELGSAWIFISLLLPFFFWNQPEALFWPSPVDVAYLLVMALLCTTLAYVLALRALKYISAFASNLTVNLEPVYGIILAWLILNDNEELDPGFYWGVAIILLSVFSYPMIKKRFEKT